jgi:predicted nuclease of predicted toxin-antitoxin system
MLKFLIDSNLPYYFNLWNSDNYLHQNDVDPNATDKDIWEFAKLNGYVIVTKDSDFSNKLMLEGPPPKIIHIKTGNQKMGDFHDSINKAWPIVLELLEKHVLINVSRNSVEAVVFSDRSD